MSSQIFVSYAHKDDKFVEQLKKQLTSYGYTVWVDTEELSAGEDWRESIDREIKKSFAIVVVMTPESSESKYVTYEWSFALGLGIPVIPVMLEKTPDIHPRIQVKQWLSFVERFHEPWDDLNDLLRKHMHEYRYSGAELAAWQEINHARELYKKNDLRNALSAYTEALKWAGPQLQDDIYYETAIIYEDIGKLDKVEDNLLKALNSNPDHVRALVQLGHLYRRLSDIAKANGDDSKGEPMLIQAQAKFITALELQNNIL